MCKNREKLYGSKLDIKEATAVYIVENETIVAVFSGTVQMGKLFWEAWLIDISTHLSLRWLEIAFHVSM